VNENITKEGIEVKRGQIWRDLDKRMTGRICRVGKVEGGRAQMFTLVNGQSGKFTFVAVRRMYKHSTGWELVSGAQQGQSSAREGAERSGNAEG
jgi:hypothetical protein